MKGAFYIITEPSLASYLELFRLSYWPNNQPAPPFVVRTESEKERIREMLERVIVNMLSGMVSTPRCMYAIIRLCD